MKEHLFYIFSLLTIFYSCQSEEDLIEFNATFEVYALLPTEGVGDQSFVDIAYRGVEDAKQDFNLISNYIITSSLKEGEEWLENIATFEKSINREALIIIIGTQYTTALGKINGNYGNNKLLFIGDEFDENKGLAAINYHTFAAPSYISSYISMQYCKQKRLPRDAILGLQYSNLAHKLMAIQYIPKIKTQNLSVRKNTGTSKPSYRISPMRYNVEDIIYNN